MQTETTSIRPPRAVQRALDLIRDPGKDRFADVALEVFAHQFANNPPYRGFCRHRGRDPENVQSWEDIPAVPTAAFKHAALTTAPAKCTFVTSGTTQGPERRGKHHLPALDLYRSSFREPFQSHLLPDRNSAVIASLIPSFETLPRSSLSFMVSEVMESYGDPGSGFFMDADGLRLADLDAAIQTLESSGTPVLILGTTLAMSEWLGRLAAARRSFALPPGSRIMDTGGFKGRARVVNRSELLDAYTERLGVPPSHVVGEYGMTELCSQFYEQTSDGPQRVFAAPPWTRTRVLNPEDLSPAGPGETGLLAHWDLANAWTVSAILTEDLGVMTGSGFRLVGRAVGAELRGCSLQTEELLHGT